MTMAAILNKKTESYRIPLAYKEKYEELKSKYGIYVEDKFSEFIFSALKTYSFSLENKLQSGNTDKKSKK